MTVIPDQLYELLSASIRTLFLCGAPIVIGSALAGALVGLFQGAIALSEPVLSYAVRLLFVSLALVAFSGLIQESVLSLFEIAFQ